MLIAPPPPDQHRETFLRLLASQQSVPPEKIEALEEVIGRDLFFLLSVFEGLAVKFPKIASLQTLSLRAQVYDLVSVRVNAGVELREAQRQVAEELGVYFHQVRKFYDSAATAMNSTLVSRST
jgi:hypothetical protein